MKTNGAHLLLAAQALFTATTARAQPCDGPVKERLLAIDTDRTAEAPKTNPQPTTCATHPLPAVRQVYAQHHAHPNPTAAMRDGTVSVRLITVQFQSLTDRMRAQVAHGDPSPSVRREALRTIRSAAVRQRATVSALGDRSASVRTEAIAILAREDRVTSLAGARVLNRLQTTRSANETGAAVRYARARCDRRFISTLKRVASNGMSNRGSMATRRLAEEAVLALARLGERAFVERWAERAARARLPEAVTAQLALRRVKPCAGKTRE